MTDVREALMLARDSSGKLVRRPLSPHLQIYKKEITSVLSILHRISGIILGVGALMLTWWLVAAASGPQAYASVQGFLGSPIGWLLLFGWTVALWYHFCSGIRHLLWDMGRGFEKAEYTQSAMVVIIATGVLTVLTWIVALIVR